VIKANCDAKVKHFCGEMGVDLWKEKHWKTNFDEYEVLVMTAQIFLNILRHGFISLSQVKYFDFINYSHIKINHNKVIKKKRIYVCIVNLIIKY
jgi:endoribonuclease Dicer